MILAEHHVLIFSTLRRLASLTKEPMIFLSRMEVESPYNVRRKESLQGLPTLNLKPPYLLVIAVKPYPWRYIVPHIPKFDGRKGKQGASSSTLWALLITMLTCLCRSFRSD